MFGRTRAKNLKRCHNLRSKQRLSVICERSRRTSFVASGKVTHFAVRTPQLSKSSFTVAYCDMKSRGQTGTSQLRIRHSARPPRGNAVGDDKQLGRIARVPKREFTRRGVNQHTLEKICRREPVRAAKLAKCLNALEEYEQGKGLVVSQGIHECQGGAE